MGEKKVLLVCSQGRYSAVGSQCSHYNAPLVKGRPSPVRISDSMTYFALKFIVVDFYCLKPGALFGERVRCPFHGACFNVRTGDIEEYPGLDSLPSYKVKTQTPTAVLNTL